MATTYLSSRGVLVIADMSYPHVKNAIEKLKRDRSARIDVGLTFDRADELAALEAQRDKLNAEYEAAKTADGGAS